jgi:O-antigen chain-terminating methyltransferase
MEQIRQALNRRNKSSQGDCMNINELKDLLNRVWNVGQRPFTSHRPVIGKFTILSKKILFPIVKLPLSNYWEDQITFNSAVTQYLNAISWQEQFIAEQQQHNELIQQQIKSLFTLLDQKIETTDAKQQNLQKIMESIDSKLLSIDNKFQNIEPRLNSFSTQLDQFAAETKEKNNQIIERTDYLFIELDKKVETALSHLADAKQNLDRTRTNFWEDLHRIEESTLNLHDELVSLQQHFSTQITETNQTNLANLELIKTNFWKDLHRIELGLATQINENASSSEQKLRQSASGFRDELVSLQQQLTAQVNETNQTILTITEQKLEQAKTGFQAEFAQLQQLMSQINETFNNTNKSIQEQKESLSDQEYYWFTNIFRGKSSEIKKRQLAYLDYFKNCKNVVDLGCGRGEFIQLLQNHKIFATGVDLNHDMVELCKKKKVHVVEADLLTFLANCPNNSIDGVFSAQVVEHLTIKDIRTMLGLSYQKLQPNRYCIIETPNPMSLFAYSSYFYLDLSHNKPLHPQALKFLMQLCGFQNLEIKFTDPVPQKDMFQEISIPNDISKNMQSQLKKINQMIHRLNALLFGWQDYAVIGRK